MGWGGVGVGWNSEVGMVHQGQAVEWEVAEAGAGRRLGGGGDNVQGHGGGG